MSVTIYLTDHNGKQIAFFYRIDNERYLTCPQLIWACRQHPEYQGTAESKEHFIEQAKGVMKQLNRSLPECSSNKESEHDVKRHDEQVRETKTCTECGLSLQGMEREGTKCSEHDFQ